MECPECGSNYVQKKKVVYESGTTFTTGTSKTVGIGMAGPSAAYGGAVTTTHRKSQTNQARDARPPEYPKIAGLFTSILVIIVTLAGSVIFYLLFSGFLVFIANKIDMVGKTSNMLIFVVTPILILLGALYRCYCTLKENSKTNNQRKIAEYQEEYWKWENTWICQSCGEEIPNY